MAPLSILFGEDGTLTATSCLYHYNSPGLLTYLVQYGPFGPDGLLTWTSIDMDLY